jgi:hypothetical protein
MGACPCQGSSRQGGPQMVMQASWGAGQGCLGNSRRAPHGTQYLRQQSCVDDEFVLPCLPRV